MLSSGRELHCRAWSEPWARLGSFHVADGMGSVSAAATGALPASTSCRPGLDLEAAARRDLERGNVPALLEPCSRTVARIPRAAGRRNTARGNAAWARQRKLHRRANLLEGLHKPKSSRCKPRSRAARRPNRPIVELDELYGGVENARQTNRTSRRLAPERSPS